MPIKKTTPKAAATKKDALKKLTVPALRAKAKRAGIKLSKTDGSQKTKAQLVLALDKVPAPKKKPATRKPGPGRKPASTTQVGRSEYARDAVRPALPPGKRISRKGRVYYERRANRSDYKQTGGRPLLGAKSTGGYIDELVYLLWTDYFKDNRQTDFYEAYAEIIDSMVTYYSDSLDIVKNLQYFNWEGNELDMEPTNISQVAYLALMELQYDVMAELSKKYNLYNDI